MEETQRQNQESLIRLLLPNTASDIASAPEPSPEVQMASAIQTLAQLFPDHAIMLFVAEFDLGPEVPKGHYVANITRRATKRFLTGVLDAWGDLEAESK